MLWAIVFGILILGLGARVLEERKDRLSPPADAPYRDLTRAADVRIEDLLARMTLKEKIGQMALVEKNSISPEDVKRYGIGAVLSGFGGKPDQNTPDGWRRMVGSFVEASKQTRLGIPILYGADAIHGHSNVPGATVFPHFISLGAARNPALVEAVARATGEELAATGIYWSFSPTLDMPHDIRWGRVYEAFSDDPALVTPLATAYIKGLEDRKSGIPAVLSTPKHYLGAGDMLWGSSIDKKYRIDQGTTPADEEKLRRLYLPPFAEAVRMGVASIMVGLNTWGDTKMSASKYLVTDVLKGELGFEGFAVSDWYGVYEIPGGEYRATVAAINAGIDLVMLPFDYKSFIQTMEKAVLNGDISEARIDDAVRRILRAKFALGLFEREVLPSEVAETIDTPAHRALAREAVAESLVLLKNETVLPIREVRRIRVAGSAADNVGRQAGAWTVEWQGIDGNWLKGATSILEGIRARAGAEVQVEYAAGGNFGASPVRADLGIAVVGEAPYAEGWGDRENPTLDAADREVIAKLKESCDKVVVVIVAGRPLIVTNDIPTWDAAVMAWLPGSEGAGVADVLFGDKPFRGKLPLPWPRSVTQLPLGENGETQDGTSLLFPRYFGLK